MKAELESVSAREEQFRAREQAKWNEVNDQLVSLECGLVVP